MPEQFGAAAEKALRLATEAPYTEFVNFTTGLVRNVFRTLIDSTREQMQTYIELVGAVAGGPEQYRSRAFGDLRQAAIKYLNEVVLPTYGGDNAAKAIEQTEIDNKTALKLVSDAEKKKALLAIFAGLTVGDQSLDTELSDDKIEADKLVKFAEEELKRSAARSFNELETLLRMGLTRIIPNKGFIETSLVFSVTSDERTGTNANDTTTDYAQRARSWSVGGGLNGRVAGLGLAGGIIGASLGGSLAGNIHDSQYNSTYNVKVVNESSAASINTQFDITGRVRIDFHTDHFPLLPQATPALPA